MSWLKLLERDWQIKSTVHPEEDDMLDMMVNGGKRVSLQNLKTVTEWYKSAF